MVPSNDYTLPFFQSARLEANSSNLICSFLVNKRNVSKQKTLKRLCDVAFFGFLERELRKFVWEEVCSGSESFY